MNPCCVKPGNLRTYGKGKIEVLEFHGTVLHSYTGYMKCKACKSHLRSRVIKIITEAKKHD